MSMWNARLADGPLGAKLMLTALMVLLGAGYLVAVGNIYGQHEMADLREGLTIDDLRRSYHGLTVTETFTEMRHEPSDMEQAVAPGGEMRMFLEMGGDESVRALTTWLERGSAEDEFTQTGLAQEGDPSAQQVITRQCVECHNPEGDQDDIPYAPSFEDDARYELVMAKADPPVHAAADETVTRELAPTNARELLHITHAHILAMPLFTLVVGLLFLMSAMPPALKTVIAPLPMIALVFDIGGWWLARPFEPAVHIIAAAGAVFGITYGVQILTVFVSLWFVRGATRQTA